MTARARWALAGIVGLGALLRFATLDEQSFWFDEAVTAQLVELDLPGLLGRIPESESTPPLYYLLAWCWSKVFGTGEVGLRSLSALVGTAAIPVAFAAAAALAGRRAAFAVAVLAAVNPLLVWYSQEARAYSLLVLLGALSLLFFARAAERHDGRSLWLWALVSALALATHYFAAFLVAGQALWLLRDREPRRRAALPAGAVAAVGLALLPLAVYQASLERAAFIQETSLGYRLVRVAKQYAVGFDAPLEALLVALSLGVAAAGMLLATRIVDPARRAGLRAAALVGAVALVLPLLLAATGEDYLETRNLIAVWLPLAVLVAAGLTSTAAGRAGAAALAVVALAAVACVVGVALEPTWQRDDWRGIARALGPARAPRAIVTWPGNGRLPLRRYLEDEAVNLPRQSAPVREVAVVAAVDHSGSSPRPPRPARVPLSAGLRVVERRYAPGYSVVRLRSDTPVLLPPAALQALSLTNPAASEVMLQRGSAGAARARRPGGG